MGGKVSVFERLSKIDVGKHIEKKGRFSYLSWSDAITYLLKEFPDAVWDIHEFEYVASDGVCRLQPYCRGPHGVFVKVSVTVSGITRTQVHPVLNNNNKAIEKPNAFNINTSIQRCLAKAIALHGLGLYVYRGEDLPDVVAPAPQTPPPDNGPSPAPEGCEWQWELDGVECKTCGGKILYGQYALVHKKSGHTQCRACAKEAAEKKAAKKKEE